MMFSIYSFCSLAGPKRTRTVQLVQEEPGELLIRLIVVQDVTERDEYELSGKMLAVVDERVRLRFEYMNQLPRNAAGKTPFVIQRVREAAVIGRDRSDCIQHGTTAL